MTGDYSATVVSPASSLILIRLTFLSCPYPIVGVECPGFSGED
jgi:hypothetical protein